MYIISWNINSIRMRARMLNKLIDEHSPSFILLQETKCLDLVFPHQLFPEYNCYTYGQKAYNGVAILVKKSININQIEKVQICNNDEARCMYLIYNGCYIINVYVPCGNIDNINPKIEFLKNFANFICDIKSEQIIAGGDYNVALNDEYVQDPELFKNSSLCLKEVRNNFERILLFAQLEDISNKIEYTWWDYRDPNKGVKIDYILTRGIKGTIDIASKYRKLRLVDDYHNIGPSDHAPLILKINNME